MNKEKYIREILDHYNFPIKVQVAIMDAVKKSDTPEDLANILSYWINQLEYIINLLYVDCRDNWHSLRCECRECLELDKI